MAERYAIGADVLPGLSKLIEEAGELGQVAGKIIGLGHIGEHWDGTILKHRLEEEAADVQAAILFFSKHAGLSYPEIMTRTGKKLALFERWHSNIQAGRDPNDDGQDNPR